MDKKDEETHSMDKPKPLEVVSDGDLSEVKKDPVWKTWLKQKDYLADERRENTTRREQAETSIIIYANRLILFTIVFELLAKKYLRAILNIKLLNIFIS